VAGGETPFLEGISSLGGATSLSSGLDSPASFDLRRRPDGASSVASSAKPYTILTPQDVPVGQQQGQLFGVKHTYKIPSTLPGNAGTATPSGHLTPRNLLSGAATPSGVRTPFTGGARTPLVGPGGSASFGSAPGTPFLGGASGAQTPARGAGFRTPAGVTVSLNPNEMEQEGVFTADVIRQQLRQHEEAAARAKQAAGQVDPADTRKRKGDEIRGTQTVTKSKKKKQFKF
ncbi:PSP protein, partial [Toxoplasma gondii RUB]